jgi:MFS family permease
MNTATSGSCADNAGHGLFKDRNFRWYIGNAAISFLGDQFSIIALPWLVLRMTGNALIVGTVLAAISVPRALFMLIGGAVVDWHSPKRVLIVSKYANAFLLGISALLVLTESQAIWMIYVIALGIGLATAFSFPSASSMITHVVDSARLTPANRVLMGLRQLAFFIGPLLAGGLIILFGDGRNTADSTGLGIAFLLDAISFLVSAWMLSRVQVIRAVPAPSSNSRQPLRQSVLEGLAYCWNHKALRACFLYWPASALFITGPMQVAVPVLADSLAPYAGAAAFGLLMGAHGAGIFFGMIFSGIKPKLRIGSLGTTLLLTDAAIGILFIFVGRVNAPWQAAALLFAMGAFAGFMQAAVLTWMQRQVPPSMIGRAMSVFLFIFMGLPPLTAAVSGWVMQTVPLELVFAYGGGLRVLSVMIAFMMPRMRAVSDTDASADAGVKE